MNTTDVRLTPYQEGLATNQAMQAPNSVSPTARTEETEDSDYASLESIDSSDSTACTSPGDSYFWLLYTYPVPRAP